MVATRVRQRQLQELFLSRFPRVFEIPVVTFPKLVQVLLASAESRRHRISETEKRCLLEGILQDSSDDSGHTRQPHGSRLARLNRIVSFAQQHYLLDEQQLRLKYQRWEGPIGTEEDTLSTAIRVTSSTPPGQGGRGRRWRLCSLVRESPDRRHSSKVSRTRLADSQL